MTDISKRAYSPVDIYEQFDFAAFKHPTGEAVVLQFDPYYLDDTGEKHQTARMQVMLTVEGAERISEILTRVATTSVVVAPATALPPGFQGHLPKLDKNGRR